MPLDTSVTIASVSATQVPYDASDTDTEPGAVRAYFLDNVTQSGVASVTVNRTNNAVAMTAAAIAFTAGSTCEVHLPGVITQGGSSQNTAASTSGTGTGAYAEQSVTDGSPGTNSMRWAPTTAGPRPRRRGPAAPSCTRTIR